MAVKATQVPSLYDKSPTSVRSRSSNVYHELSDKVYNFHSTSFIQKPSSRTSSASDNSIINKTSRGSSRSSAGSYLNDNAARRGSDESKRYYELEKRPDNVMNNSMNDIYWVLCSSWYSFLQYNFQERQMQDRDKHPTVYKSMIANQSIVNNIRDLFNI